MIGGVDDSAILETIACREALALAQDLQLHDLVVASDAKNVVGDVNKSCQGTNGAIIQEINRLASSFNCIFNFESRVVNIEAHRLAKHALALGLGRHVWYGQSYDQRFIPHSVEFAE